MAMDNKELIQARLLSQTLALRNSKNLTPTAMGTNGFYSVVGDAFIEQ